MTYISSQDYIDWDIVDKYVAEMQAEGVETLEIPCVFIGAIDGTDYAVVVNKHHRLEAAKILGIAVEFATDNDTDGMTGEEYLENHNMGAGFWYNVENSDIARWKFDIIW